MMKSCTGVHMSLLISLLTLSVISARPALLDYGLDHRDVLLPRDTDDVTSPELRLRAPIIFYGERYQSVYINQNGLISFRTPVATFLNMPFPMDYPSIAPFYSDVDTRIEGSVYYREAQEPEYVEAVEQIIFDNFGSAVTFQPTSLLIVTWDNVGYYDRKSDKYLSKNLSSIPTLIQQKKLRFLEQSRKTNTYQLIIASSAEDSYALFLYDKIEWIQGTGKNPSQPDAKAQAGFSSGFGPYFTVRGSGTDQVSNLHKRSNSNTVGLWAFRIGRFRDNVEEPDRVVERLDDHEESTSSCSVGFTECHTQAQCIDYSPGFCCKCVTGFFGNGRICLQDAIPQRVTGKVKGVLNGIAIEDSDLFAYVLPGDGRAYTAIARIPDRLGFDIQALPAFGTIVGWMFSTQIKGAPNGFQLTGGVFNYTAEVSFPQTGQKVTITQYYEGLDVFSHLKVDTRVFGQTAVVPFNKSIEIGDYEIQMTRVSPGLIRSQSTHNYRVEGTSVDNPISIEQTISYHECSAASPVPPELETTRMKVGRNYIQYDADQQIARYAITSKVVPLEGEDPCKENKESCGPNSSCVANDDSYKCICDLGYEEAYNEVGDVECVDIDECRTSGVSTCDVTAVCVNVAGSYRCECQHPFTGDGYTCTKILSCEDVRCGSNAACVELSVGAPECRCIPGYYGDGVYCVQITGSEVDIGNGAPDCRNVSLCDPDASCIFSYSSNSYICACNSGYHGDGLECTRAIDRGVRPVASCTEDYCFCPDGYAYDSFSRQCEVDDIPHEEGAVPVPVDPESNVPSNTCDRNPALCDPNGACDPQPDGSYDCVCRPGFLGDGHQCSAEKTCRSHDECGPAGECAVDYAGRAYFCKCRQGYEGRSLSECRPAACGNCDRSADCSPTASGTYECRCRPGYQGDGFSCMTDQLSCYGLNNCSPQALCEFDPFARGYRCQCREGFKGDGVTCQSVQSCRLDRSICDENAQCVQNPGAREWSCVCVPGFRGDGQQCEKVIPRDQVFLLAAKGMSVFKVPANGDTPSLLYISTNQTAIGIAQDCGNERVYWSDVAGQAIRQGYFNGSGRSTFLFEDIGSPEGLALDSASQLLYWTDSLKDTIEVAHLVTKQRRVLIDTGLVNPRGIAIYHRRGLLFWTDWNRAQPKIEYSGLDGLQREIFIGEGLSLPNSLIIDEHAQPHQICWADAGTHRIECAAIEVPRDARRPVHREIVLARASYPFGLAYHGNTFYWSDWNTTQIETSSRTGLIGQSLPVALGGPGKLYGLALVPATCPQEYSTCVYNQCQADQICLPNIRGGRSCLCANSTSSSGSGLGPAARNCADAFL